MARCGAWFERELERTHLVEADLFDEIKQVWEFFFGLAR